MAKSNIKRIDRDKTMKATELQIGDLVLYNDNVVKVTALRVGYDDRNIGVYNDTLGTIFPKEDEITPITLTKEILELNGWKKHATYDIAEGYYIEEIYRLYQHSFEVVFNNDEAISIGHFDSSDEDGCDKLLIETRDNGMYVYILQHALRLFGLNDLANNFKVE